MKIVADEGIERPIVVRLRAAGHDVIHIAEIAQGITDPEVAEILIDVISERQDELFHAFSVIAVNKRRTIKILQRHPEIDWPHREGRN